MKKSILLFIISLSLFFSTFTQYTYAINLFEEGVYQASDLNFSSENKYIVQNISETNSVYLQVFDENQIIVQSIRLTPKSDKFNLTALLPGYRIVIVGKGNVFIS
ncbi:hypothetical protein NSA50_16510 [Clostridium sp. DSM 100503]|uniref:hypothetical protein n=1 Tax=Clostridium sp. DSM 100503 TaxID=2963282 RepID=UPI00214A44D3|nr:hypothetical protein [Clostridium sp. DSM 100503]MCR1952630.1 hypothetical protein [Clostridium sp. DSM 100503]